MSSKRATIDDLCEQEIVIPDCEAATFKALLQFLYTDSFSCAMALVTSMSSVPCSFNDWLKTTKQVGTRQHCFCLTWNMWNYLPLCLSCQRAVESHCVCVQVGHPSIHNSEGGVNKGCSFSGYCIYVF